MSLFDWISELPLPLLNHWGYWLILFFIFLEASPVFGLFVPGQVVAILGGFFAKTGILEIGDVIWVVVLAAVCGDFFGYLLGRVYGNSFISRYGRYFLIKKDYLKKIKKLMKQHLGKTLIAGRFNSLTRSFAPFVAGMSGVKFFRFMLYNIVGGISWALAFVLIGYIFGKSYEIALKYVGRFVFIAVVLSILIVYTYRFVNKRRHIFVRYHLYALILNIVSLYLFSKMAEDVINKELITRLDSLMSVSVVSIWSPVLNKIMILITSISNSIIMSILSVMLFIFLVYKKKWHNALLFVFSMSGGLLLELLIKILMQRPRPENALISVPGYSFPSGHVVMATIFFSFVIYSFKEDIKNKILRIVFIVVNTLLLLLIGFSRIYLKVHWLSDVVAGFALGLFWLTLLILAFRLIAFLTKNSLMLIRNAFERLIQRT